MNPDGRAAPGFFIAQNHQWPGAHVVLIPVLAGEP